MARTVTEKNKAKKEQRGAVIRSGPAEIYVQCHRVSSEMSVRKGWVWELPCLGLNLIHNMHSCVNVPQLQWNTTLL